VITVGSFDFPEVACTTSGGRSPPASAPAGDASRAVITVGSFDFPESVLLAYLYADALSARGFPAARLSTPVLAALDALVELDGRDPGVVAERWLQDQGLTRSRLGVS
jgi:glycine betaine/choline ABC-type transport system substrate-binding protein